MIPYLNKYEARLEQQMDKKQNETNHHHPLPRILKTEKHNLISVSYCET